MSFSLSVIPRKTSWTMVILLLQGLIILVCLAFFVFQLSSTATKSDIKALALKQNEGVLKALAIESDQAQNAPTLDEITDLKSRVDWYNQRIKIAPTSLDDYLDTLEDVLPNDVRVRTLFYDPSSNTFSFAMLSKSEESLLRTMPQLQDQLANEQVNLERQNTIDEAAGRSYQFDVRVVTP